MAQEDDNSGEQAWPPEQREKNMAALAAEGKALAAELSQRTASMKTGVRGGPVETFSKAARESVSNDEVNHPSHYNRGGIEVIDAIEAWGLGFHAGNAVKYIARAGHKGDALTDLKKARWYLQRIRNTTRLDSRASAPPEVHNVDLFSAINAWDLKYNAGAAIVAIHEMDAETAIEMLDVMIGDKG